MTIADKMLLDLDEKHKFTIDDWTKIRAGDYFERADSMQLIPYLIPKDNESKLMDRKKRFLLERVYRYLNSK